MSRFSQKGYFVKENAAIYLTTDMDRTAKWFEDVMGWYSNIVERDGQGRGRYGVVFDILPEVEATHLAPFTGFQMFAGEPVKNEISFMQVQSVDSLYRHVIDKGWDNITPVETQPWGGKVCRITTIDGYTIRIFELWSDTMSLNETVSAERPHIAFFGMRNAGKSSLVNAVTGQQLAVVSDVKGTTTDPVRKAMELLPIGPVVIIDTPGLDDEGELGRLRVQKSREILAKTDIAVLVVDAQQELSSLDRELLGLFNERGLPYCVAYNKADLLTDRPSLGEDGLYVSAKTMEGVDQLKEKLGSFAGKTGNERRIVADLLNPGDIVVLVTPIDAAAPKGRMILPQQQTMRDILDAHCAFVTCQTEELAETLQVLAKKPKLVITDSQAFQRVAEVTPRDILLTSFSILFARYKGSLPVLVQGAAQLSGLKDGDPVLISEGCTHHRQCGDIGTVKLPGWIESYTGVKPSYTFTSGGEFPENPEQYKLVVHCGGCMLNEAEMKSRVARAKKVGVPIVNYGIAIAHMHGILERSLEAFPDILKLLGKQ